MAQLNTYSLLSTISGIEKLLCSTSNNSDPANNLLVSVLRDFILIGVVLGELNTVRGSTNETVGIGVSRQPNVNNDTEISFGLTIAVGPTESVNLQLQISVDDFVDDITNVGPPLLFTNEQPDTPIYLNKIIQRSYYYRIHDAGSTGTVSMSDVTELTL